jgi:hypothetical protein
MYGSIWKVDPGNGGSGTDAPAVRSILRPPGRRTENDVYTADDAWKSIQLEAVNVETGRMHALTNDREVYADPVFSPDGQRLAWRVHEQRNLHPLFVLDARRPLVRRRDVTTENSFGRPRQYFSERIFSIQPAWLRRTNCW